MAVFTEVSFDEAAAFLRTLDMGQLRSIQACTGGIENTNYFVDTETGAYVLTLFERLATDELPFYLHLMQHLAGRGIPVPDPMPDRAGRLLHQLKGKPAVVVDRLRGRNELQPSIAHCRAVGAMLARLHLAGRDYDRQQANLRGLPWWEETVPMVWPYLREDQRALLSSEMDLQRRIAESPEYASLARGPIHGDLFRDNVLFDGERLTGILDFYFAGCDTWLYDIGVSLNDWCVDQDGGRPDHVREAAFIEAYESVRPLPSQERGLLPALQRAAALRFWLSRLRDLHLPRQAAVLKAHDPGHFERILRHRAGAVGILRDILR
ncbi:homoserine kinase [Aquincola sp. S2]|uniref:Homoserine kinase n=1 Tax=Pseudaquabacterium terrae TaxID=2732868 RepID=A0ABX2EQ66_9BURK|nr:homoserine kinase [Aquabacterium terrae]NRF70763.1 homoserine kinase [Aquabacterium terrae]